MLPPNGADIKSASGNGDAIVFDAFDGLYLFDTRPEKATKLDVKVRGDLPGVRTAVEKVVKQIQNAGLSPTGARAVFEARGEILTVPAEKGDVRNLTNTPGRGRTRPGLVARRQVDRLLLRRVRRVRAAREAAERPGRIEEVQARRCAVVLLQPALVARQQAHRLRRQARNLWLLDLATGKSTKVDTDP